MTESLPCQELCPEVIDLQEWRARHEAHDAERESAMTDAIIRLETSVGHRQRLDSHGDRVAATGMYSALQDLGDRLLAQHASNPPPSEFDDEPTGVLALREPKLARKLRIARIRLYLTVVGGLFGTIVYTILKLCKVPLP